MGLAVYIYSVDGPPVDDAAMDVRPTYAGVNGLPRLEAWEQSMNLNVALVDEVLERDGQFRELPVGERTGGPIPGQILERYAANAETVAAWQAVLESDYLHDEPLADMTSPVRHLAEPMKWARYMMAVAEAMQASGRSEEALNAVADEFVFGYQMTAGSETMITFMVGLTVTHMALGKLEEWVGTTSDSALLARLADLLARDDRYAKAFAASLKSEYRMQRRLLEGLAHNDRGSWVLLWDMLSSTPPTRDVPYLLFRNVGWAVKPETTKRLLLARYRQLLEPTALSAEDRRLNDSIDEWDRSTAWWKRLHPNAVPIFLTLQGVASFDHVLSKMRATQALQRVVQTAAAIRRYQLAHGRLPENLPSLVPEYLPAVPLDPFDGKPLRYDVRRMVLWSIGKDGIDQSGIKQKRWDDEIVGIVDY